MFAPLPILLVVLGAGVIALGQTGFHGLAQGLKALVPLFTVHPDRDRDAARAVLYKIDEVAQIQGIARTDRVRTMHAFVTDALAHLANAPDADRFAFWAERMLCDRTDRHGRAIGFWTALADAAPAMGMTGTIIGLIGMFSHMQDPDAIGPAMALALMTTLHGMILANAIAGPIASRLSRLSLAELAWQREMIDRMTAIARRETLPVRHAKIREVA